MKPRKVNVLGKEKDESLTDKRKPKTRITISEKEFRQQVIDLARLLGYKVYFSWTSIHSPAGFPDLLLVHPERKKLLFVEVKSQNGHLTDNQEEWLRALATVCPHVYVWRPSDFDDIARILEVQDE